MCINLKSLYSRQPSVYKWSGVPVQWVPRRKHCTEDIGQKCWDSSEQCISLWSRWNNCKFTIHSVLKPGYTEHETPAHFTKCIWTSFWTADATLYHLANQLVLVVRCDRTHIVLFPKFDDPRGKLLAIFLDKIKQDFFFSAWNCVLWQMTQMVHSSYSFSFLNLCSYCSLPGWVFRDSLVGWCWREQTGPPSAECQWLLGGDEGVWRNKWTTNRGHCSYWDQWEWNHGTQAASCNHCPYNNKAGSETENCFRRWCCQHLQMDVRTDQYAYIIPHRTQP